MTGPWTARAAFALGLAIAVTGMSWLTVVALGVERSARESRAREARDETVRSALWRMDSAFAPFVATEAARPYFAYSAFYPAERAYDRMFGELSPGDVLIPSPLLTERAPFVRLHFQVAPDGTLGSPQVPASNMRDLAESGYVSPARMTERARELDRLRAALDAGAVRASLAAPGSDVAAPPLAAGSGLDDDDRRAREEFVARQNVARNYEINPTGARAVPHGPLEPVRHGDLLLLARRVALDGGEYLQGMWLDEAALCAWLIDAVADVVPGATLAATDDDGFHRDRLASLPLRFEPGAIGNGDARGLSPIRLSLILAWGAVLGGALGIGGILRSALRLGERRAAFVSAVTHELRTPLTTFRMYADLLAEHDDLPPEKRERYLATLVRESDRLGHLVENVLAYARLERGGPARRALERFDLRELIERIKPSLRDAAERAGLALAVATPDGAAPVRADRGAVERILHNLVDNAAKYARGTSDPAVSLRVTNGGGTVSVTVADRGPGVPPAERRRIFRPFRKSATEAAHSAPGVGLGLALARRLAREMGGELTLDDPAEGGGASFTLTLPAAAGAV